MEFSKRYQVMEVNHAVNHTVDTFEEFVASYGKQHKKNVIFSKAEQVMIGGALMEIGVLADVTLQVVIVVLPKDAAVQLPKS